MVLLPEPEQEGKGGAPAAWLLHRHGLQLPQRMGTGRPLPGAPGPVAPLEGAGP